MTETFLPQERALLCDYFGIARPDELADTDVRVGLPADGAWSEPGAEFADQLDAPDATCARPSPGRKRPGPILVEPDVNGDFSEHCVANAVARMVLASVQRRLPQWSCKRGDGRVVTGRRYRRAASRPVGCLPHHLFTMNWGDSGPGFAWPESYYVTFVPGFDRVVVTASNDSPDAQGYSDFAIGWFPARSELAAGAKEVILRWWTEGRDAGGGEAWEQVWEPGLVSEAEALAWRDEVWPTDHEDSDDSDGDYDDGDGHHDAATGLAAPDRGSAGR